MKLVLHYFRNYVRLRLTDDEFRRLRQQLISKSITMSDKKVLEDMRKQGEAFSCPSDSDPQNKSKFKNF